MAGFVIEVITNAVSGLFFGLLSGVVAGGIASVAGAPNDIAGAVAIVAFLVTLVCAAILQVRRSRPPPSRAKRPICLC
jgi:hypothetical protein